VSGLEIERFDGVPVARAHEDIDAANARSVRDELTSCVGSAAKLVIDLSETRYVDSAGVDMLFRLNELLRQRRVELVIVIPAGSQLRRLAEIVALPDAIAVHETVEQALGACSQRSGA
jgi:anti-anti-sigma factor